MPPGRQPFAGPALRLSRSQAVDAFVDTFRAAVQRRLPSVPFQMPLSGGRDSRHILCELVDAGCRPTACVTIEHFPPRGNDDVVIAAALCARLGLQHVVLPQREDRVRTEWEKNERTHYCTDEHAQFVALADYLALVTPVTYDGIAGDVLTQSTYLRPDMQRLWETANVAGIAAYLLDGYGTTVSDLALSHLVSRALLHEVPRERAIARLTREIARHLESPNPISSFFFWNRTRREVALAPFALMRDVEVHTPYLDEAVFALLSALPASLQMDRQFHTDAIRRGYPGVADIPYESRCEQQQRPGFHRRTALALGRRIASGPVTLLSPRVMPSLAATAVDGSAERLWHAPLTIYLTQLAALATRAR